MRKKKTWLSRLIPIFAMGFFVFTLPMSSGCAARFVNKSAASIGAAANIYDIAMRTIADLQAQGYINAAQREKINAVAMICYDAVITADNALIAYNNTLIEYNNLREAEINKVKVAEGKKDVIKAKLAADKAALKKALEIVSSSWADFAALVNDIRPDTLPNKL
jgi:ribosomal protein L2